MFEQIKNLIENWKAQNGYDCPFDYETLRHIIEVEDICKSQPTGTITRIFKDGVEIEKQ